MTTTLSEAAENVMLERLTAQANAFYHDEKNVQGFKTWLENKKQNPEKLPGTQHQGLCDTAGILLTNNSKFRLFCRHTQKPKHGIIINVRRQTNKPLNQKGAKNMNPTKLALNVKWFKEMGEQKFKTWCNTTMSNTKSESETNELIAQIKAEIQKETE